MHCSSKGETRESAAVFSLAAAASVLPNTERGYLADGVDAAGVVVVLVHTTDRLVWRS